MKKILILGGGFGGVRCALDLEKKIKDKAQITLIDKNSYHLFLPALYEVASVFDANKDPFSLKLRKTICIPLGDIFAGKNINFIQAEISAVDLKIKKVTTKGGEVLFYDYLVFGLGSQTADFGIPGVKEYAYQFKNVDDAMAINRKVKKIVEKKSSVRILIGGAGFSGIEFAAEISCCVKKMCAKRKIKGKCSAITLVEAGPKILSMVSDKERKKISKRLTELGVVLMENSPIEEVGVDFVKLKSGQILEGDMVVWTAGIKANEFLKSIPGLPVTDKGKIIIDENLKVRDLENVFAVGDNQEFIDTKTQKPVPALAYTASDQGKVVAENIYRLVDGNPLKRYSPYYGVWIAPVGGKFALAHLWYGFNVSGLMGWIIRELVDLKYLTSILSFRKAVALFWHEIVMFTKND